MNGPQECYHDRMQYKEFQTQVKAHGVKLPHGWAGSGGHSDSYRKFAGLGNPGTGNPINFTDYDVRLAVAWGKVHQLTGTVTGKYTIGSELGRWATRLLALHHDGWIIMSNGQVWWMSEPTKQVFDKGAICIPAI